MSKGAERIHPDWVFSNVYRVQVKHSNSSIEIMPHRHVVQIGGALRTDSQRWRL